MTDPVTPTDTEDPIPPEEDGEVEQGARMDPHGYEPEDDALPEGITDGEDDE